MILRLLRRTMPKPSLTGLLLVAGLALPGGADAHQAASAWTYPPACCKGDAGGGDCQQIPATTVRTGPHGFVVQLFPGDHHLVTKRQVYLIPYGDQITSGDGNFHICLHPTEDHANCFFAPPDGM
jgi:hypothetical protein